MERKLLRPILLATLGAIASVAGAEGDAPKPRDMANFFSMLATDQHSAAHLSTLNLDASGKQELLKAARAASDEDASYQAKQFGALCARASSMLTRDQLADEFIAYKDAIEANQVRIEQQAFAALSEPVRAELVRTLTHSGFTHETRDQMRASILGGSGSAQSMLEAMCAGTGGTNKR